MAISVLFARALLDEVRARGLKPEQLLLDCNIDSERLVDLRELLSPREADLLIQTALRATAEPALGLVIGSRAPFHMLQLVGHLLLAQPTLRHAFAVLTRYSTLLAQGIQWSLHDTGAEAVLSFACVAQSQESSRCATEYIASMSCRIGRHFLGAAGELSQAQFRHRAPQYRQRYSDFFQCPVLFEQDRNALTFPSAYLDREQSHHDNFVRAHLRHAADQLLAESKNAHGIVRRLNALLRQEDDLSRVSLKYIAPQLDITVHMLRRSLAAAGVTLSSLLAETRCALAREHLSRPGASVIETAALLGFSERTAFDRAFRRWTSQTPAQFIKGRSTRLSLDVSVTPRLLLHQEEAR